MSNEKDDGGNAFPRSKRQFYCNGYDAEDEFTEGMSLRDWFAGMALQGILSNSEIDGNRFDPDKMAEWSYQTADAMIEARKSAQRRPHE